MSPLSSPTGCLSCARLCEKIAELEDRISLLFQIKEDEHLIDSLLATANNTAIVAALDTTAPRSETVQAAKPWSQLGARPKLLSCSTPSEPDPWKPARGGKRSGRRSDRHPQLPTQHCGIALGNRFSVLQECDVPPESSNLVISPTIPVQSPRQTREIKRSRPFVPRQGRFQEASTRRFNSADHIGRRASSRLPPPATLIVGDSIVRNIRRSSAVVHSFSGAKVADILLQLPFLLEKHSSVQNVIIHAGCNNIRDQRSEVLKRDFNDLFSFIESCGKRVFISGPIPSLGRGIGRFSRTLSLHTWLQETCSSRKLAFIDNFNLFWNRPSFFRYDRIHPSNLGTQVLADNMFYTMHNNYKK